MVRLLGIEPRTSGSTIRRSNQLSYNRTCRAPGLAVGAASQYGLSNEVSRPRPTHLARKCFPARDTICTGSMSRKGGCPAPESGSGGTARRHRRCRKRETGTPKKKKTGGRRSRSFPCVRPAGGGAGLQPAFWWEEDTVPRVFTIRTLQATFSSLSDFSKAVLAGLATSSAAFEEAAWRSLACSTMVSKRWRMKAP